MKAWRQKKKKNRNLLLTVISYLSFLKKSNVFTSKKIWKHIHTQKENKVKSIGDHFTSLSTYVWIVQKACKECGVVAGICTPVNCTVREDTQLLRSWAYVVKITSLKGSRYLKDSLRRCPPTSVSILGTCTPRYPDMTPHTQIQAKILSEPSLLRWNTVFAATPQMLF